jgi:riboflavin kinase/FMN adenylyltransferase
MRAAARRGLAVGFFDGVHRGHQAILSRAAAALTFRQHPLSVLDPARAPRLLMTPDERLQALRATGVSRVIDLPFTRDLAETSASDFLAQVLLPAGADAGVFCGANWRFGRGGEGDAGFLRARGVPVEVVPFMRAGGERVSSTAIRAALERADLAVATEMLGAPWRTRGSVVKGKGLGREIGFPTVNFILPDLQLRLPRGVYAVSVWGASGLANFGVAPTMGARAWDEPRLEVYFPQGVPAAGAGEPAAAVSFLRYLRPERKFDSVEALTRQIAVDCGIIKTLSV